MVVTKVMFLSCQAAFVFVKKLGFDVVENGSRMVENARNHILLHDKKPL